MKVDGTMNKDIDVYWEKYNQIYGFEKYSAIYRERKLLDLLQFNNKTVLEIGCGYRPIFMTATGYKNYTALEPGRLASDFSLEKSKDFKNVQVIKTGLEAWSAANREASFDLIILPGVLHEVDDPKLFFTTCFKHLKPHGQMYINVPNAGSLHRRLAAEMGLIKSITDHGERNVELQQNSIFSLAGLEALITSCNLPLNILVSTSFFLKPFTHEQMMEILDTPNINLDILEGFYSISEQIPDMGSEIACVIEKNGNG